MHKLYQKSILTKKQKNLLSLGKRQFCDEKYGILNNPGPLKNFGLTLNPASLNPFVNVAGR